MVMNPIIEINGDRATGVWYFFGPFTRRKNNEAKWQSCRYQEDYVKIGGEWKNPAPTGASASNERGLQDRLGGLTRRRRYLFRATSRSAPVWYGSARPSHRHLPRESLRHKRSPLIPSGQRLYSLRFCNV